MLEECDWEDNKLPDDSELVPGLLLQMDVHKPMGPEKIHPTVLKDLAGVIMGSLSISFQQSWESGEVPSWPEADEHCPNFQEG